MHASCRDGLIIKTYPFDLNVHIRKDASFPFQVTCPWYPVFQAGCGNDQKCQQDPLQIMSPLCLSSIIFLGERGIVYSRMIQSARRRGSVEVIRGRMGTKSPTAMAAANQY